MKVAIHQVTSSYSVGGCETYTWELARFLKGRGHAVHLVAGRWEHPLHPYPDVSLQLARFLPRQRVPNFGSRFRKLLERLSFGWHCRGLFAREKYDLVNIHKPYDVPAALWFRRRTGCRVVWRCHGTDFYPGLGPMLRRVDAIYAVSHFARQSLVNAFDVPVEVIHTGVDTDFFDPQKEMLSPSSVPQLLYFGRLEGWKGVRHLVEALGLLKERGWTAKIVGDGPQEKTLKNLAASLDLGERLQLQPALKSRDAVRRLLAAADIVVFTSVAEETFSNALLEAMSMGRVVVATNVGGFPETIDHGENGWLVPARDSGALAEAIQRLLADGPLRQRLGRNARDRMVERFDATTSFGKVESLFMSLAERRQQRL